MDLRVGMGVPRSPGLREGEGNGGETLKHFLTVFSLAQCHRHLPETWTLTLLYLQCTISSFPALPLTELGQF